jgi:hypothetical protein
MVIFNVYFKIMGMLGLLLGIEVISIVIFSILLLYLRSPITAGIIGNISSLSMILGIIIFSIKREIVD